MTVYCWKCGKEAVAWVYTEYLCQQHADEKLGIERNETDQTGQKN